MSVGVRESAGYFDCEGERLLGISHHPGVAPRTAVLLVVGGPQYRVGSHRQFLLLARRLAASGIGCLRFDYRGMGDSSGELRGFEHLGPDLRSAVEELHRRFPGLEKVVLWGLCDAASALLLHGSAQEGVDGLVLLNPWVTEGEVDDTVMVKHYYLGRLRSGAFWRSLLRGEVAVLRGGMELMGRVFARLQRGPVRGDSGASASLSERMREGLERFPGRVLLITSGQDLTAAEFLERAGASTGWQRQLARSDLQRLHIDEANHTFSSERWRGRVEQATLEWILADPEAQTSASLASG